MGAAAGSRHKYSWIPDIAPLKMASGRIRFQIYQVFLLFGVEHIELKTSYQTFPLELAFKFKHMGL